MKMSLCNKPAGLVVHPGAGHNKNALVNALIYHWPEINRWASLNAGDCRIDKTSGVMIGA